MKQAQRPVPFILAVFLSPMVFAATPGGDPPAGAAGSAQGGAPAAKIEDYVRELSKVSPRDADGFYRLGRWCEEHGLADKARKAYERAIRIDPDHAQARAALKHRPQGSGWTEGEATPAPETAARSEAGAKTEAAPTSAPAVAPAKTPKSQPPAAGTAKDAAGEGGTQAKAPPSAKGEPKAEVTRLDDQVAAKKRWAQEAAQKLELTFALYEDEDFLIHTTCESGSQKVKALTAKLKSLKKLIQTVIGRSKGPMWPGKQHFIFMRESTECMRFAQAIDGQRFPEEAGIYSAGDEATGIHTVLSAIIEERLADLLARTALESSGAPNRYVGWWLDSGVSQFIASQTDEGRTNRLIEQAFRRAGAELEAKWDSVSIIKVLESEYPRSNAAEALEAEALTLVQYLFTTNKSSFQAFIQDLKSPEAPVRQGKDDKLFMSKYAAYQERTLRSNFHDSLEKMGESWKKFVATKSAELEKTQKSDPKNTKTQKTQKTGKQGTGKTKGGKPAPEGGDRG